MVFNILIGVLFLGIFVLWHMFWMRVYNTIPDFGQGTTRPWVNSENVRGCTNEEVPECSNLVPTETQSEWSLDIFELELDCF